MYLMAGAQRDLCKLTVVKCIVVYAWPQQVHRTDLMRQWPLFIIIIYYVHQLIIYFFYYMRFFCYSNQYSIMWLYMEKSSPDYSGHNRLLCVTVSIQLNVTYYFLFVAIHLAVQPKDVTKSILFLLGPKYFLGRRGHIVH